MNGSHAHRWSAAADSWAATWGASTDSARTALVTAVSLVPGERVLDAGCGSGEFLRTLHEFGADVAGADPAPRMRELARRNAPRADVRDGGFERLPWPDAAFDVVVAVNALQFAEDMVAALREAKRLLRPGGRVGVANWAESHRNDIETIESALSDEPAAPDDDYRCEGGLERLLNGAGLTVVASGSVPVEWHVPDDETLIRGVLLGESARRNPALDAKIVRAARPFAAPAGYRLQNAFRFAVGVASPG